MHSIKWENFDKLQINKIENINFKIENLLSNVEDTFINKARKVQRETRMHKEDKVKNKKSKNKNWFNKACSDNYTEFKTNLKTCTLKSE